MPSRACAVRRVGHCLVVLAVVFLAAEACGGSGQKPTTSPTPVPTPSGPWRLVWSDEFDGADGSAPDSSKWTYDIGGQGWGNQELETYTNRRENAFIRGGNLVIQARQETYTGSDGIERPYTSARLRTQGRYTPTYGRFEARIRIPRGQGLWPAFWLLGDDTQGPSWPAGGEIDIMENIGREPTLVHGTMHGPGYSGSGGMGASFSPGGVVADDYHVFAVEWETNVVRWYVDGTLYFTRTAADLPAGARWVFDHPFFIILNVAVGGSWPGDPDGTSVFPQEMLVDWVRVSQR